MPHAREPLATGRRPRPAAARGGCALLVALLSWTSSPAPARAAPLQDEPGEAEAPPAAARYAGLPLAEALGVLASQGLEIAFSGELVTPELRVVAEPTATDPRAILDEILAPHGLEARDSPSGLLVVVAKGGGPDRETPASGQEERVLARPLLYDEIVVFPSRLSLLHEEPDAPFSLTREELEDLPHLGGDAFRAVSLFPGTTANDVTARFSVHGGRRDEVRIVLDGQELYDAFHLQDYDHALSIVPARSLAGASLTTGAFPASQGDRMSAVLDLTTVDPPAGRQYLLGLSVLDALASSSGRFAGDRGAWLATGRRGSLDLAGRAIGDEHPAFWDLLGKAELATGLGRFAGHVLVAGDELELDQEEEDGFERLENDYRRAYGWLTHQATPGDRLLVETVASWADIRRDRAGTTREEEGAFVLRDERDLEVLALSQAWSLQLGSGQLGRWGWEARRYDAAFDYAKDLDPEILVVAPFSVPRVLVHRFAGAIESEHVGLWASDRLTLFDRLTAELGLRYDRHSATDDSLTSPRVHLAWRLGERAVLRAAWGRFFQSQRPYELQVEDAETALHRAELSEHWVLGYEALLAPGQALDALRVELFRREIDDPRPRYENLLEALNFFPEIEPDRVRIAPERSSAEGVEVLVRGRRGERFDWWLAYSYARAEDRLGGETVPRSLDQPHTAVLDLNFRLPREWNLNLAWRYHTGWPTTPVEARLLPADGAGLAGAQEDPDEPQEPEGPGEPEEPEEPELAAVFGRLNSERLRDFHRLDLRASRTWRLRAGRLTFFVDVQNLYDRKNLAGFDLAVDEEEGTVELEEEDWPGIFPSLGVLIEF
jgi:outer membrane receptor protein involved in Fe transport